MNVEYTGRQYEITSAVRKEVETGLAKIRKILGDQFDTKVILAVEKHRHKAEITISPRNGPIVGLAQANDMAVAIGEALEHLERQAVKYKTRLRSKKRHQHKKWNGKSAAEEDLLPVVGATETTAVSVVVHKFPARRQNHRSSSDPLGRSRRSASHDTGRGHQRSPLPRPRCVCLSRQEGQSDGPAPHPRRKNAVDRSAVSRPSAFSHQRQANSIRLCRRARARPAFRHRPTTKRLPHPCRVLCDRVGILTD